jgi:hypothetical protein
MSEAHAEAFTELLTRTDALYFAVTVFTTVGFGDITPLTEFARIVTTIQMVADLLVVGLFVRVALGAVDAGRRGQGKAVASGAPDPGATVTTPRAPAGEDTGRDAQ